MNPRYTIEAPDGLFISPFQSILQWELSAVRAKLKEYHDVEIEPDRLIITVCGRWNENVAHIQNIVGPDYLVKRAGFGSKNIIVTVKA